MLQETYKHMACRVVFKTVDNQPVYLLKVRPRINQRSVKLLIHRIHPQKVAFVQGQVQSVPKSGTLYPST